MPMVKLRQFRGVSYALCNKDPNAQWHPCGDNIQYEQDLDSLTRLKPSEVHTHTFDGVRSRD